MSEVLVKCRTCHREERWRGETREVALEGGARRPEVAPELAAWRVLLASHRGELGPVVAACPACAQPMVAEGDGAAGWTPIPWTLSTPEGDLEVRGHGLTGPRPLDWAEAEALVLRTWPPPPRYLTSPSAGGLAQSALLVLMLVPVLVWLFTASFVTMFLINWEP